MITKSWFQIVIIAVLWTNPMRQNICHKCFMQFLFLFLFSYLVRDGREDDEPQDKMEDGKDQKGAQAAAESWIERETLLRARKDGRIRACIDYWFDVSVFMIIDYREKGEKESWLTRSMVAMTAKGACRRIWMFVLTILQISPHFEIQTVIRLKAMIGKKHPERNKKATTWIAPCTSPAWLRQCQWQTAKFL